jgi:hypothetical protein
LREIFQEDVMIRLSCWIGAKGCGGAKREAGPDVSGVAFPSAAPGLLEHFHPAEAEHVYSLDELLFGPEPPPEPPEDAPSRRGATRCPARRVDAVRDALVR